MHVVMLGAPGAGKGTQADILSRELQLSHIASGDLFRQALEKRTDIGLLAKSYMDRGELVPDEITIRMVLERIDQPGCAGGCLFDGFPRTPQQARTLDQALKERGMTIDKAVYIEVSDDELVQRLSGRRLCRNCQTPYHITNSPSRTPGKCHKCGGQLYQRPDDGEETVRERLKVFLGQTVPVLDYYEKQGKLVKVNGNLAAREVAREILSTFGAVKD